MPKTDLDTVHINAPDIFLACSRIALASFGAPLFWARRELVERRRWLTEHQFTDLLAIGQILPGANVLNLLVMFGHRSAGWRGALAAIAGFIGWPFFIVIGLGVTYERFATIALVRPALIGMSAVAAGLLLGSSVKMAAVLPHHWHPWACGLLAFVGAGLLHWPLLIVLAVLAPYSIWIAWKEKG